MTVNAEFAATLRSQVREALANPPAPEPTQPEPVEAAPVEPVEPAPATTPESPSPVEAAPSPAPAESPSAAQPTPASDVPTTSADRPRKDPEVVLAERGMPGVSRDFAEKYLRLESELAASKRAEKNPAPPAESQPEPQQTAPEPTPAPKTQTPTAAVPEPPAQTTEMPANYEQEVAQLVARDTTCVALVEDYRVLSTDIESLWKLDRHGRPVGGQIFELNNKIAKLNQILSPNEDLRKDGVPLPDLDPIQRQDLENRAFKFELERRNLIDAYNNKLHTKADVEGQYAQRLQEIRSPYERAVQERAEAEQRDAEIETKAQAFESSWKTTQAAVFTKLAVPEKLQATFAEELIARAKAQPGVLDPDQMADFMESVIKREQAKLDAYHREKAAEYAAQKRTDAQVATQAPNGQAAVAAPSPNNHQDWQRRLKADVRAALS